MMVMVMKIDDEDDHDDEDDERSTLEDLSRAQKHGLCQSTYAPQQKGK